MNIHVTGANGFLASYVIRDLEQIGQVDGTDVDTMDIMDLTSVMDRFRARPPDVVVHLAALLGRAASRSKPVDTFNVNMMGTLNLLEACRKLGIDRFVLMSSITVHGKSDLILDEDSPIGPIHPYGASKAAAEAAVHAYVNSYGLRAVILRPNFIVGPVPSNYRESLIYNFIEAAMEKGLIELAGDGSFEREWMHPEDIAKAVKLAILEQREGCETFILSDPENRLTMMDLANRITRVVGKGRVTTQPTLEGFSLKSSGDRVRQRLNWRPEVDVDTIIQQVWEGYQRDVGQ